MLHWLMIPFIPLLLLQAPLEPYACTKDLRYFLITPTSTKAEASQFVASTADTYRQCSLGKHSPAPGSQLFPDAPILPLPTPAENRNKEQRRVRPTQMNSLKSAGTSLTKQESLKRTQRCENLHSKRIASTSAAVPNQQTPSAGDEACHGQDQVGHMAAALGVPTLVPGGDQLGVHPMATQHAPFRVPDHTKPAVGKPFAATNTGAQMSDHPLQQSDAPNAVTKSIDECSDSSVPEW